MSVVNAVRGLAATLQSSKLGALSQARGLCRYPAHLPWRYTHSAIRVQPRRASGKRGVRRQGQEFWKGEKEIGSRTRGRDDSLEAIVTSAPSPSTSLELELVERGVSVQSRTCHLLTTLFQHRDFPIWGVNHLQLSCRPLTGSFLPPLATSAPSQRNSFSTVSRLQSHSASPGSKIRDKMSNLATAGFQAVIRSSAKRHAQPEDAELRKHHLKGGKGFRNPWDSFVDFSLFSAMKNIFW